MAEAVKPANKSRVTIHTAASVAISKHCAIIILTRKSGNFRFPASLEGHNEWLKTLELPYYFTRFFRALLGGKVEEPALGPPSELGQNGGKMLCQRQQQSKGGDAIFVMRMACEVGKAG